MFNARVNNKKIHYGKIMYTIITLITLLSVFLPRILQVLQIVRHAVMRKLLPPPSAVQTK